MFRYRLRMVSTLMFPTAWTNSGRSVAEPMASCNTSEQCLRVGHTCEAEGMMIASAPDFRGVFGVPHRCGRIGRLHADHDRGPQLSCRLKRSLRRPRGARPRSDVSHSLASCGHTKPCTRPLSMNRSSAISESRSSLLSDGERRLGDGKMPRSGFEVASRAARERSGSAAGRLAAPIQGKKLPPVSHHSPPGLGA